MVTDVNHLILWATVMHHRTLLTVRIVQLGTIDSLAVKEADELACFTTTSLCLGLQSLDCNGLKLAERGFEPALLDRCGHDGRTKHLRFFLALALLLLQAIAWVSGLSGSDLFLMLSALSKHTNLLLHSLDLVESLIGLR